MTVRDSTVKCLHVRSTNKTSKDNIILLRRFPGACTKSMKQFASPDLEKIQTSL